MHEGHSVKTLFENSDRLSLKPHDFVVHDDGILFLLHDEKNGKDHIQYEDKGSIYQSPEIVNFHVVEKRILIMNSTLIIEHRALWHDKNSGVPFVSSISRGIPRETINLNQNDMLKGHGEARKKQ